MIDVFLFLRDNGVVFYKRIVVFLIFFILFIGLMKEGISDPCPDWVANRKGLPLCPTSRQASILPESLPTGAVVVSSKSFDNSDQTAREFTTSFVEQVVRSASSENMPLILLMGVDQTTERQIRNKIRTLDISPEIKNKALEALRSIRPRSLLGKLVSSAYTWQQDYFEAFATSDGKIRVREVQSYVDFNINTVGAVASIVDAGEDCGFEEGPPLKSKITETLRLNIYGYAGGNIEGLPGGFCLLGDDHFHSQTAWEHYADQFCGEDRDNRIQVSTGWLYVGHTDEIMKIVKNNNPQEGQCDFSVALSSPKKAAELLAKNQKASFTSLKSEDNHHIVRYLCEDVTRLKRQDKLKRQSPSKGISNLFQYLIPYAYGYTECNLTNGDILRLLQGDTFLAEYNRIIQTEMDKLQRSLTTKISSRLNCTPDFIQTPDLYYTSSRNLVDQNGSRMLPNGEGKSILPNSTNAVSIGNSIILSEPGGNAAFNEYMRREYAKRGITARFVDTSNYAHLGVGNLHCVTHTIHICQPRPSSSQQGSLQGRSRRNAQ